LGLVRFPALPRAPHGHGEDAVVIVAASATPRPIRNDQSWDFGQ
jgi:hypothetical protein